MEPKTTTSGATAALFDDAASCAVTPEETEGPYYFDADKIRSDIREDRKGTRLRLALRVRDAGSCTPIQEAVVDIWARGRRRRVDGVFAAPPYSERGDGDQRNDADGIFEEALVMMAKTEGDGVRSVMSFDVRRS